MSNFCKSDEGFDYIFGRMSAIYGNDFARKWDGIDPALIRSEWIHTLGGYLTYRPIMDYALEHMAPHKPPSSLQFRDLCRAGPGFPPSENTQIENYAGQKYTEAEKQKALAKLAELKKSFL